MSYRRQECSTIYYTITSAVNKRRIIQPRAKTCAYKVVLSYSVEKQPGKINKITHKFRDNDRLHASGPNFLIRAIHDFVEDYYGKLIFIMLGKPRKPYAIGQSESTSYQMVANQQLINFSEACFLNILKKKSCE